jgi:allantoate deiminase
MTKPTPEPTALPIPESTPIAMRIRAAEAIAECRHLATMTEEPGRLTRRFLTPPVAEVHAHLRARMHSLGMRTHVDAIGNLRGLWQPNPLDQTTGKRLLLGSHIDTVPNAGAFDGVLGVVLALEWVRIAQELAIARPIEVIAFSEEEGVRYAVPFLGSQAVTGSFDMKLLACEDAQGIRMDQAIRAFGLDPTLIPKARIYDEIFGYLEIHIEQGPLLEAEDLPVAVVEGIAGQSRLSFHFTGHANHAGTTPMHIRRDALAGAVEWMQQVEAIARQTPGLVATIGKLSLEPGAANVIPGRVELSLDVRHMRDRDRTNAVDGFVRLAESIAGRRDLHLDWSQRMNEASVPMNQALSAELAAAVESAGFPLRTMPSGAGHDAMIMAQRMPSAMLFLRSPGGISHHPDESVLQSDVEAVLHVGSAFLTRIDSIKHA